MTEPGNSPHEDAPEQDSGAYNDGLVDAVAAAVLVALAVATVMFWIAGQGQ